MIPGEAARAANRARFARLVARPESEIDLALGALMIAAEGRPDLDFDPTVAALDVLADRVRLRLDRGDPTDVELARLHDVLYREWGFRAPNSAEYHDIGNSQLDRVVDRRVGLPITLAIVELEVAWRLGLPLHGIGLQLTRDDCQALLRHSLGERVLFHFGMLRPVGRREILARVLRNLRSVHLAKRDWPAALAVVELLEVIEPTDPEHSRDRGLLLGRMGRFTDALALLRRYLDERPDGSDASDVRQVIGIFRGRRN